MAEEQASLHQSGTPGERLKGAREHFGWSVQETADKLHVIPRYVKAIENADYAQLPGLVFLKGYIRSYARLVGLPEALLIEQLEQDLLARDHPILQQVAASAGPFAEEEVKTRKPLWYSLVLLIIVVIAYFIWANYAGLLDSSAPLSENESLQSESAAKSDAEQELENNTDVNRQSSGDPDDSGGLVSGRDPVTGELRLNIDLTQQDDVVGQMADNTPDRSETVSSDLRSGTAASGSDPLISETGSSQSATSTQQIDSVTPATTSIQSSVEQNSVTPDTSSERETLDVVTNNAAESANQAQQEIEGLVTVEASFSGDCWFDLRDRDNDRIVGLYRSGDSVKFNGQYPLQFIVGAVNAVTIKVDGRILNFNDYSVKNNRAQFTLEL